MGTHPQRRVTAQRAAIHEALRSAGGFRSAQELHDDLRGQGHSVGLATVYRELQSLSETGDIDLLVAPSGESIYRLCLSRGHHHHLVCRSCGTSVEIASEEVERWARTAALSHGFSSVVHVAELYGVCAECTRR
jgi:Fur family ferric uptake transcriptional regulator